MKELEKEFDRLSKISMGGDGETGEFGFMEQVADSFGNIVNYINPDKVKSFYRSAIKKMIRDCKPSRKKPNILKKIDQKNFDLVDKVFYEKGFNDGVSQFLKNLKDKYGVVL